MKLQDKLLQCKSEGKAILAANFYNYETLAGVVTAAAQASQPIILQLTESSIDYMGLKTALGMGRSMLERHGVEGWIHLDHGATFELAEKCLAVGFDSVMIDGSELPLEENIALTRAVVEQAAKYGVNVEAELGYVAKLGQAGKVEYTDPETARVFVQETSVNALAVAIGNAHGFYKSEPKLDLERLSLLNDAVSVPLVLHGSSGIPADQLQESIRRGICKINLATELKNAFMRKLQGLLRDNEEIDLRKVFPPATSAVAQIVTEKLRIISRA